MSVYRPEYLAALEILAAVFDEVVQAGYERPILVGGAAVEFYTGGAVTSGDFDILTPGLTELEAALQRRGFVRPSGPGVLLRGLHHPELGIGVEVVSGHLFDGASDRARVRVVPVGHGSIALPPVEDMIADRMGQYAAPTQHDREMLGQAIALYRIARQNLEDPLDEEYLDRRIKTETLGECDLGSLIEKTDEADDA